MHEPRSVVITGASRGLGLASAAYLYGLGWRVVAAMRSPEAGLERLRQATGAAAGDSRLIGVRLDLSEPSSIASAAKDVEAAAGAPDVLVHNAGIAAVGCLEDMPISVVEQVFATNLLGPIALTRALLPAMRAAGRGRIVVVSSQGGSRGMPSIGAYSASKGALERWAEALAQEIAPFGLGVTILVCGTFDTDILTERTPDYGDYGGPYAGHYAGIRRMGDVIVPLARPPALFARALARALDERAPFARRAVGFDARLLLLGVRFLPGRLLHHLIRLAMRLPRHGALGGAGAAEAGSARNPSDPRPNQGDPPCRSSMHSDSTASACSSSAAPPGWAPRPPSWRWRPAPTSS
jgi:NAD(P)-dependent dehydrogenase (short-subunit alcohol dehydrogenase family)